MSTYKHEALTGGIIKVFYEVYNELGNGFLESVYRESMVIALRQAGIAVQPEMPLKVYFRGQVVGEFKPDIVVEGVVILELKACRAIEPIFEAQLLNYLRATDIEVGLLLNFGPKPEIKRMVYDNPRKGARPQISTDAPNPANEIEF